MLVGCLSTLPQAGAAESRGRIAIEFQHIHTDGFQATTGDLDIGTTDTDSIDLELELRLGQRWTLSASLPWIRKRYQGRAPHDPAAIDPPVDSKFIDTGGYHSSFQDLHIAVQFAALDTPFWLIAPFAYYGQPVEDYTFFAQSAVGQNLRRFGIGTTITWFPPFSDFYLTFAPGYEFVEETLGTNISHWRIGAEVGYFLNPALDVRGFALIKEGNGRDFPDDFPPPRDDEWWYQHDRMVRHNYVNLGLGLDWQVSERNRFSVSGMTMVHADQVHIMKYTVTLGLSRTF